MSALFDEGAELGLGHKLAPHLRLAPEPPHVLAPLDPGYVVFEHIAWHHRFAELRLVDGQKVDERRLGPGWHRADANGAGSLRHSLEHKHARHDRVFGEVTDKLRLVERDV